MTEYSVGIPVRNEENTLGACISSVLKLGKPAQAVYVCLNGSNEATRDIAAKLADEHATVRILESRPGKSNAWNAIVRESKTNMLLFTDGDVQLPPNAAERLLFALDANPRAAIASGNISYAVPSGGLLRPLLARVANKPLLVGGLAGALYMMRRDRLFEIADHYTVAPLGPDILSDDAFLRMLTVASGALVTSDAHVTVQPISTIPDYFRSTVRSYRSNEQLRERYPDLFEQHMALTTDVAAPRHSFPPLLRFAYAPVRTLVHLAARLAVFYDSKPELAWPELKSTKQAFK